MIIIDGKKAAATLREELKKKISELKSTYNAVPGLTVILVGEDPPSKIYVRNKEKFANEIGIKSDDNEVYFITRDGFDKISKNSKQIVAEKIVKKITEEFF